MAVVAPTGNAKHHVTMLKLKLSYFLLCDHK